MTSPPNPNSNAALATAIRGLTQQMQAMLHQQQTYTNLPSSSQQARQARQNLTPAPATGTSPSGTSGPMPWAQGILGGQYPAPLVPTAEWTRLAGQSLLRQALGQPQRTSASHTQQAAQPPGPTPPPGYPSYYPGQWGMGGAMQPGMPPGMLYPGMPGMPVVMPGGGGGSGGGGHGGGGSGMGSWARSSLPMMGMRVAGPWGAVAGAALAVGSQIPGEIRAQRDKNAYYQSIEGGSNFSGFGERLSEEAYRWSTFGVLSSDESRQAFKGVTKLGYNSKVEGGEGRQDALNFIYHGKTSYGASVDESLQELQVASKSALVNFRDLSSALKEVSDSAGEAGVNAQMARAEMTQLMDQAIKSGYGSAATDVAQLEQQTKTSYGRSFQDVDVSGRLTSSHAYMAASLTGMSVSQYLTGGATVKGTADQRLDAAAVQAVLKPGAEEWIKEQIAASGGDVTEDVAMAIGEDLLRRYYENDPYALAQVVAALSGQGGLAEDPIKAATWIVQQYNNRGALATAKTMDKKDRKKAKDTSHDNRLRTDVGDRLRPRPTGGKGNVVTGALPNLEKEKEGGFLGFGGDSSGAVKAYEDWHDKTENEDPVVYNLLNEIEGDRDSKVAVSTPKGKRVVSLEDAIKRHRNELASGKAVLVEGDHAGKTVAEVLGEDNVDPLRDFSKEAKRKEQAGQSYRDWEREHTVRGKGGKERLEIGLSAEARRLLVVLDSTGASGAAATAEPPLSPYPANPSYQE